jgi:hypothetical protein
MSIAVNHIHRVGYPGTCSLTMEFIKIKIEKKKRETKHVK